MSKSKLFSVAVLLALTGCGNGLPDEERISDSIVEVTLKDGTRCVVFKDRISQGGNISCDWRGRNE